ncbi:MAG: aminotransferase class I/II-fold pyridoxal phosphate-dependent enzyme, partial [Anaerolineales bacterium]|nr:aminotransferase class I/II-fold pyridoxal phosphate-dependent enzyme [Anaerolineales bacterium]
MNSIEPADRLALTPEMLWDIEHYKEEGLYFYLEATQELLPNGRVNVINYGEMIMLGGYSYLGLIGHPKINAAAKEAIDHYGTGTYGVRLLAGSLKLHNELEARIAEFKHADAAITMSSG